MAELCLEIAGYFQCLVHGRPASREKGYVGHRMERTAEDPQAPDLKREPHPWSLLVRDFVGHEGVLQVDFDIG